MSQLRVDTAGRCAAAERPPPRPIYHRLVGGLRRTQKTTAIGALARRTTPRRS
jgi:hypothetical protein